MTICVPSLILRIKTLLIDKGILVIFLVLGIFNCRGKSKMKIAGEYYLQGVHEMASGFILKENGEFQFFFSYGALDRMGSGKWTEKDGKIIFQTEKALDPPFVLTSSESVNGTPIKIRIDENNPVLRHHVFCTLEKNKEESWQQMDADGTTQFPAGSVKEISVLLEFCPEKIASFPVTEKDHNQFVFRMQPSIMDIFFNQFSLVVEDGALKGGHPLMKGQNFSYTKS